MTSARTEGSAAASGQTRGNASRSCVPIAFMRSSRSIVAISTAPSCSSFSSDAMSTLPLPVVLVVVEPPVELHRPSLEERRSTFERVAVEVADRSLGRDVVPGLFEAQLGGVVHSPLEETQLELRPFGDLG